MAIYCSKDGTQHPDDANFCMKCGQPLRPGVSQASTGAGPVKWEYTEIAIPLDFQWKYTPEIEADPEFVSNLGRPNIPAFDTALLAGLKKAGEEGWQPDEPTDLIRLARAHRIASEQRQKGSGWFSGSETWWTSVTIRFKRLVSG